MANVTIEVPDDLLAKLRSGDCEPGETLRVAAAFSLCSQGELSTSQAARLAGMTYSDFLEAAARAKISLYPVNMEELTEEIRCGFTLGRQRIASHPPGQGKKRACVDGNVCEDKIYFWRQGLGVPERS
jgi:predicted HTH domain antitoxin